MKLLTVQEADRSRDMDIKLVAVRASKYRVFGSPNRIPEAELAIADLRDNDEPDDFAKLFQVLERHPVLRVSLVRRLAERTQEPGPAA
jgi:hypothetical protein